MAKGAPPVHPAHKGADGNDPKQHAIHKVKGGYAVKDLNPATKADHPHGFGTSKTKAEALKHLAAIQYFKHAG